MSQKVLSKVVGLVEKLVHLHLACSRRSDSGVRAKTDDIASERAGKNKGILSLPSFFPLFRSLYFSLLVFTI